MERTTWTDARLDDAVGGIDGRFDSVDRRFDEARHDVNHRFDSVDRRFDEARHDVNHRFDRVEGDLKELRQMVWYLWGSMLIGFLVVIATVLVGGR
jgi:hypothetical protein